MEICNASIIDCIANVVNMRMRWLHDLKSSLKPNPSGISLLHEILGTAVQLSKTWWNIIEQNNEMLSAPRFTQPFKAFGRNKLESMMRLGLLKMLVSLDSLILDWHRSISSCWMIQLTIMNWTFEFVDANFGFIAMLASILQHANLQEHQVS